MHACVRVRVRVRVRIDRWQRGPFLSVWVGGGCYRWNGVCRDKHQWLANVYGGVDRSRSACARSVRTSASSRGSAAPVDVAVPIRRLIVSESVSAVDAVLEFLKTKTAARPTDPTTVRQPVVRDGDGCLA